MRAPPGGSIPTPTCAVCGRHVERVRHFWSPRRDAYVITAFCHGQEETSELPGDVFRRGEKVAEARAFVAQIGGPKG